MGEYTKQVLAPILGPETFVIGCTDYDLKKVVSYRHPNKKEMFDFLQLEGDERMYLLEMEDIPEFM